ncbi:MAG: peptide-methionine (S)-S-oxide reductase MsrA [Gammaproteobacteria bacterium]|nr:peptide-methionine (S)-S-oxide reductase MsrA [Gammaproteobacteria bacterium]
MTIDKSVLPNPSDALAGRSEAVPVTDQHFVHGRPIKPPYGGEQGLQQVLFGLGCFWGAERKFWQIPGVFTTAVGYAGGFTPNPSYEEVCTGRTGHNEVVLVVYRPAEVEFTDLLATFFESHDPTQGMRQGNDMGTQYRSGIYCFTEQQRVAAQQAAEKYQAALTDAGHATITTEIKMAGDFYYAENYHQQYLAKNPQGYCGIGGTGVSCAI